MASEMLAVVLATMALAGFIAAGLWALHRARRARSRALEAMDAGRPAERISAEPGPREAPATGAGGAAPTPTPAATPETRRDAVALRRDQAAPTADAPTADAPAPAPAPAAGRPAAAPAADPPTPAPAADQPAAVAPAPAPAAGDDALRRGLARTQTSLWGRIRLALGASPALDETVLEGLEEALLLADVGVDLSGRLLARLRAHHARTPLAGAAAITGVLAEGLREVLAARPAPGPPAADAATPGTAASGPRVILFVGVNGVGKTTSLGKVAARQVAAGERVLLAAGDTFRAAAAEQLEVWARRAGAGFHRGAAGADPAGVIFDAVAHARAEKMDVVLADTAGRLHTKTDLMDQLRKVRRAADKAAGGAPVEVWLVVDATTGQNALLQAREFDRATGLTGIILTKLDGTAKGGVVVAVADAVGVPIRFVGVGETAGDLRPFDPADFVAALLEPA